jgi:UDP-glucose 4-epimerase
MVTGGAGYIGSHTVRLLMEHGHDVWVFDNLSTGHRAAAPQDRLIVADLKDAERVDHALIVNRIEAVVHFAAFAYVGESVADPAKYYQNNLVATLNLMDRMRRTGVSRMVFSSSCVTYGIPDRQPLTEDMPQNPINPYGNTKLGIERALADYAVAYKWGYAALRYFNASGASSDGKLGEDHDPETHLIPRVIYAVQGKIPHLELFGTDYPTPDGTCVRDYVHVQDLAEAHRLVLDHLRPGVGLAYNLATERGSSVREVIKTVEAVTGKRVPVKEGPRRPGDPAELTANASKVRRELGWKPTYAELQPIVETAWNWHRTHPNGYGDR